MNKDRNRMPDWPVWRGDRKITVWQGVALSLNIDPDQVKRKPDGSFDEGREFDRRLAQANAMFSDA